MFIDRFGRRVGFGLIVFGICTIAAGVLAGLVLTEGLKLGFETYLKYDENSKFNDPTYEDCDTDTLKVYFYNLTNYQEVLTNDARPNFTEVGPYTFDQETCIFKEHADTHWKYYKKYWKDPVQTDGSESDIIYNFNPAYGAVNYNIKLQTGETNTERVLIQRFTGQALTTVLSTMEGPSFTDSVKISALPTVYTSIKATAMNSFVPLVRLTAAWTAMWSSINATAASYSNFLPERNFFNTAAPPFGVTTYYNTLGAGFIAWPAAGSTFTDLAINRTLYLGVVLNLPDQTAVIPGWSVATQVAGLQAWLYWYQVAAVNPTVKSIMSSAYNLTLTPTNPQLDLLANWLSNYMMTTVANANLGGATGVNNTAQAQFYGQWSNSAALKGGLDLNADAVTPDGFELGTAFPIVNGSFPAATGVSLATTTNLWNVNSNTSILSSVGINTWFTAIRSGNPELLYPLGNSNGLTNATTDVLSNYLQQWQSYLVVPFIYQQFQISNLSDLAYIQWGSGALLGQGVSVQSIQTTLPYPPEFAVYAYSKGSPVRFSLSRSKFLLKEGKFPFFEGSTVELFFDYLEASDYSSIYNIWGLSQTEAIIFGEYLYDFGTEYVTYILNTQVFPYGGGPVTWRTAKQWMYTAEDPLLKLLGVSPFVGLYYNASHAANYSQADAQEDYRDAIFRGGTRDDLKKFLEVKEYNGLVTVNIWKEPVRVEGNDGGDNFVPASLHDNDDVLVWNERLVRPITFKKSGEFDVKGIPLWKLQPTEDLWRNEIDYPDNALYFQEMTGLLNITPTAPAYTFISRPGFYGADLARAGVDGIDDSREEFKDWIIGVNWQSGFTMYKQAYFQISAGISNYTEFYNITGRIIPFGWIEDKDEITDKQATRFKTIVNGAKNGSIAAYVIGCVLGGVMTIFGVAILLRYRYRKMRQFEEQVKGMNLVELPEKF
jgi:hypothetical protein